MITVLKTLLDGRWHGLEKLARAMCLRPKDTSIAVGRRIGGAIPGALKDELAPGELLRTSNTIASALFDAFEQGAVYGASHPRFVDQMRKRHRIRATHDSA